MQLLAVALAVLSCARSVLSLATPRTDSLKASSPLVSRSSSTPRVVIYTDDYISGSSTGLPSADDLSGYNVLILAFLMTSGAVDQAAAWKALSDSQRTSLKTDYDNAGITLMVSAFGSTDAPTSDGHDAASVAQAHAAFVKANNLRGIDVDYEDMNAVNKADGSAEQWLITYTRTLRNALPSGQYFCTHAPVAPWFSPMYTAGAYRKVNEDVGDLIDWYNVQFYNQGDIEYGTCNGLLWTSSNVFPKSSVFEIHSDAGVSLDKIVIGKPSAKYQASNGWMDFSTLAACIAQAGKEGWAAGTMLWEYEKGLSSVSAIVQALAAISGNGGGLPVLSTTTTTSTATPTSTNKHSITSTTSSDDSDYTPTTTTSTSSQRPHDTPSTSTMTTTTPTSSSPGPTTTTTSPGGGTNPGNGTSCSDAAPWDSNAVYSGGSEVNSPTYVTFEGCLWANKWWTQGDKPCATEGNPWTNIKSCPSSKREYTAAKRRSHKRMRRVLLSLINDLS